MNDTVREGRAAERILNDDVFQKAVQMADDRIIRDWRDAESVEEREKAHAQQEALEIVLSQLRTLVQQAEWESEDY